MTKPVGEYVYHASYLPDQSAGLKSIIAKGLQPSADGYAGPGVYFAYDPEGGFYHVSEDEATMFRVKWADLVAKFGTYPQNPNGIQRDEDEIIVPGAVPASMLEVEYFEGEWWDLKSAYHSSLGPLDEAAIDNTNGAGAVPYNADVDYFGLRVAMKPSTFLELALPLNEPDNSRMEEYIRNGGAIGAPFLDLAIPPEWDEGDFTKFAKIQGHEGRHRMKAIIAVEGDHPVEVHLFPKYYRARDITPGWAEHINSGLYAEKSSRLVRGPLFSTGAVSESIMEGGWASTATQNTIITPGVVQQTVGLLDNFAKAYNAWQEKHELGLAIEMGDPVGSGTYYKRDLENDPEREYGDIDVRCWIDNNGSSMAQRTSQYRNAILEFCRTTQEYATENGNNIIVQTPAGAVQVDLIFTLREHGEWSKALAPEYRVKGAISTSLMSALAEVLNMSFGLQGVQVKTRAGRPVSFRQSKDTQLQTVSIDPHNWAKDMFKFYYKLETGQDFAGNLQNLDIHSGMKDEQRLSDIVHAVRSLAFDLEASNLLGNGALDYIANASDMLKRVAQVYSSKLDAGINSSKFDKAETPAAIEKANKTKLMLAKYRNEITKLLLS